MIKSTPPTKTVEITKGNVDIVTYALDNYQIKFSADRILSEDSNSSLHLHILLLLIQRSRESQQSLVMSAAKAITVLNAANVLFSGNTHTVITRTRIRES